MIKTFDNKINIVGDDLKTSIKKNSKISVSTSLFSIYGFESLKKELKSIENLRFIFTDSTFLKVKLQLFKMILESLLKLKTKSQI